MDEDNNIRPLDKLLTMLKSAGWDCIADEADSYLVVIDANGDPHECWDGGMPDYVNVCIPLSVENAMDYFADPNQIYLKAENAKLRYLAKLFVEYVSQDRCEGCVFKSRCNDGLIDECFTMAEIRKKARELGIEVGE